MKPLRPTCFLFFSALSLGFGCGAAEDAPVSFEGRRTIFPYEVTNWFRIQGEFAAAHFVRREIRGEPDYRKFVVYEGEMTRSCGHPLIKFFGEVYRDPTLEDPYLVDIGNPFFPDLVELRTAVITAESVECNQYYGGSNADEFDFFEAGLYVSSQSQGFVEGKAYRVEEMPLDAQYLDGG